jgi:hypothetical protein
MDEFRQRPMAGDFWLPGKSRDVFKGELTIAVDNHGTLVLRGSEEHLGKLPTGETQPTFYGRLAAHYTYEVTLFEAS